MAIYRAHVLVCRGTGCTASGAPGVMKAFKEELAKKGLDREAFTQKTQHEQNPQRRIAPSNQKLFGRKRQEKIQTNY